MTNKAAVELREITRDNFDEAVALSVSETQRNFVSANVFSLAQAWVYKDGAFPFAIYAGDTMVGFVMLGRYEERSQYTLWKLMIDEKHQHKGYGWSALSLAIDYAFSHFDTDEIYTGVAFGNEIAHRLYASAGFEETGEKDEYCIEMRLRRKS